METEKSLEKIKELQRIGKSVINKTVSDKNDRTHFDSLHWLRWENISIQEIRGKNFIIKNEDIDYSKVKNPEYGRFRLPLKTISMSDRDFAKYVRLIVKYTLNRNKARKAAFWSKETIKELEKKIQYEYTLLHNKEKYQKNAEEAQNLLKDNFTDFVKYRNNTIFLD